MSGSLYPDPISGEGGFCAFLHRVHMYYLVRPIEGSEPPSELLSMAFSGGVVNSNVVNTVSGKQVNLNFSSGTPGRFNLQIGEYSSEGGGSLISSYNFTTGVFDESAANNIDVDVPTECYTTKTFSIPSQADNASSKTYSVVCDVTTAADPVTNLTLHSSIPDAINERNLTTQPSRFATISCPTVGNLENDGDDIQIASRVAGSIGTVVHNATFLISDSRGGENNATKARDVVSTDFNGWFIEKTGSITNGTDVLTVASTTGLTVGQTVYMDDLSILNGAEILAVTNSTTLQLSETLTTSTITDGNFKFGSTWSWNTSNIVTTQTSANLVTITADITCTKYGYAGETGDLKLDLSKGFIT